MRALLSILIYFLFISSSIAQFQFIDTISRSSTNFTGYNNKLFFTSNDSLFSCDGNNISLIKTGLFKAKDFKEMNGSLYFLTDNNKSLWKTDGTENGTVLIKQFLYVKLMKSLNNKVFLTANDSIHGNELWITDGTTQGTVMVKDINPGQNGSITYRSVYTIDYDVVNNQFYFIATNGLNGYKIWKSDGEELGTEIINLTWSNIDNNSDDSITYYYNISNLDGTLYFSGYYSGIKSVDYSPLCKLNVANNEATVVKDIGTADGLGEFKVVNSLLYFVGESTGTQDLYRTDGTSNGTFLIRGIVSMDGSMNYFDTQGDKYLWCMPDFQDFNSGIFRTDGNSNKTVVEFNCSSVRHDFEKFGDLYYYTDHEFDAYNCDEENAGILNALWQTDSNGNKSIIGYPFTSNLTKVKNTMYFTSSDRWRFGKLALFKYENLSITTSNKEKENSTLVKVFPNPANEQVIIENYSNEEYTSRIINSMGKVVFENNSYENRTIIDLNSLKIPKGIYFIKLESKSKSQTVKLIIN